MLDEEILALFRQEAEEHLVGLETSLLDLEAVDDADVRRPIIDKVFRHAHSLKGAARAVGLEELQDLGQILEDSLDALRDDPENVNQATIDKTLAETDAVRKSFDRWNSGDQPGSEESGTAATEGNAVGETQATTQEQETTDVQAATEIIESATVDKEPTKAPSDAATPATSPAPAESVEKAPPAPAKSVVRQPASPEDKSTVRVPTDRLDRILSLAGEVRVSQRGSMAVADQLNALQIVLADAHGASKEIAEKGGGKGASHGSISALHARLDGALERLRQIQSDFGKKRFREELMLQELEEDIRLARLVPLATLTDSLRRTVRDLVQSLGKSIQYRPDVGDTLLDKAVMESLKDPMLHLIRNAADHGIETPDQRTACGKSPEGMITITATRRGERIVIRISDDGRGIDFDRIRERLRKNGSFEENEIADFSEQELARFLFQPGFTTRQEVTNVSGRGVGLDVVLDGIHRLQGTVDLESSSNQGSTFLITVPVTISTLRILTVQCAGQPYGIPTDALVRTGRASPDELRELEGTLVLPVNKQPVRWVELADVIGAAGNPAGENNSSRPYLLLHHDKRMLAVAVEELQDESEVILKPLGYPLADAQVVVGGTIRPDGSVQLVLDPTWLVGRTLRSRRPVAKSRDKPAARILVTDDSPTTRSILRNLLAAAGYSVQTAVDGVDAMQHLAVQSVDLVVSDVEMPRMNGFELTRQVKSRFDVPVVLVTSLDKEEDRRHGMEAGADAYVVKTTFQDQGLLDVVKQFV